jgi:hypothetical protein
MIIVSFSSAYHHEIYSFQFFNFFIIFFFVSELCSFIGSSIGKGQFDVVTGVQGVRKEHKRRMFQ